MLECPLLDKQSYFIVFAAKLGSVLFVNLLFNTEVLPYAVMLYVEHQNKKSNRK